MKCLWQDCSYENENIDEFCDHIIKHTDVFESTWYCKWKDCPKYGLAQINKYALHAHLKRHIGDRPFKCEICSKSYSRSEALKNHVVRHKLIRKENDELLAKVSTLTLILDRYKIKVKEEKELRKNMINNINNLTDEIVKNKVLKENGSKRSHWNDYLEK
ncbi:Zinc finger protein [Spraguea lophii 42_110]|uniref:Zinc finger protein n=1 Tax=Spraguea lophii (strain 42_110) TaxID=1358809 RepID=S7W9S3_SPRLO|nr:Zinc finger protein [Spraguea lophii 42_110]